MFVPPTSNLGPLSPAVTPGYVLAQPQQPWNNTDKQTGTVTYKNLGSVFHTSYEFLETYVIDQVERNLLIELGQDARELDEVTNSIAQLVAEGATLEEAANTNNVSVQENDTESLNETKKSLPAIKSTAEDPFLSFLKKTPLSPSSSSTEAVKDEQKIGVNSENETNLTPSAQESKTEPMITSITESKAVDVKPNSNSSSEASTPSPSVDNCNLETEQTANPHSRQHTEGPEPTETEGKAEEAISVSSILASTVGVGVGSSSATMTAETEESSSNDGGLKVESSDPDPVNAGDSGASDKLDTLDSCATLSSDQNTSSSPPSTETPQDTSSPLEESAGEGAVCKSGATGATEATDMKVKDDNDEATQGQGEAMLKHIQAMETYVQTFAALILKLCETEKKLANFLRKNSNRCSYFLQNSLIAYQEPSTLCRITALSLHEAWLATYLSRLLSSSLQNQGQGFVVSKRPKYPALPTKPPPPLRSHLDPHAHVTQTPAYISSSQPSSVHAHNPRSAFTSHIIHPHHQSGSSGIQLSQGVLGGLPALSAIHHQQPSAIHRSSAGETPSFPSIPLLSQVTQGGHGTGGIGNPLTFPPQMVVPSMLPQSSQSQVQSGKRQREDRGDHSTASAPHASFPSTSPTRTLKKQKIKQSKSQQPKNQTQKSVKTTKLKPKRIIVVKKTVKPAPPPSPTLMALSPLEAEASLSSLWVSDPLVHDSGRRTSRSSARLLSRLPQQDLESSLEFPNEASESPPEEYGHYDNVDEDRYEADHEDDSAVVPPPPPAAEVFQVEAILKHKKKKKQTLYLVKWLGYPSSENTWEPTEMFDDPRVIPAYWERLNNDRHIEEKKKKSKSKSKRRSRR